MGVDAATFDALVREALDGIPDEFAHLLEQVVVVVEEEPSRSLLRGMGLDPRADTVYGTYEGTPLAERPHDFAGAPPDRIVLFRGPLRRDFPSRSALRREIRATVVHELGHFLGLGEDDLRRFGY